MAKKTSKPSSKAAFTKGGHSDFVHLRVRSAFSLLEGAVRPKELAALARDAHMPAVAVTDTSRVEVLETAITAPGATVAETSETLPYTGFDLEATGGIAFSLVAMGGLMLLSFGYRPREGRNYRGRHRQPTRPVLRQARPFPDGKSQGAEARGCKPFALSGHSFPVEVPHTILAKTNRGPLEDDFGGALGK